MKLRVNVKDNFIKSIKSLKWYEIIMIIIMIVVSSFSLFDSILGKNNTPIWLAVVNFISALSGLMCVFLCTKASVSNFIFGLLNTTTYAVALFAMETYGSFILESCIYFPVGIISWIYWAKHRDKEDNKLTLAKKMNVWQLIIVTIVFVGLGFGIHPFLEYINGKNSWIDSFIFSAGFLAVFLKMLRYKEQYYMYFIYNGLAVVMFIFNFNLLYLTKKSIYLIITVFGIINWIKLNKERNKDNA